jgi:V8-like Glu-specific endopeptidase
MRFHHLFALSLSLAVVGSLPAQIAQQSKTRHDRNVDSRLLHNNTNMPKVVFTHIVKIRNAEWTRLFFESTHLPVGSKLRITGLADNWTQFLNADSLVAYFHASCFFRGEEIKLELVAGPKTQNNRVKIYAVDAGNPPPPGIESICDTTDERKPSSDKRQGRLSVGCTGWLYACDLIGTAGHCSPGNPQIIHFNTALSSSTGTPAPAHPDDQYANIPATAASLNGGVGADWGICRLAKNSNTGKYAGQVQGWYQLGAVPSTATGNNIRITGYGTTASPISRTWNQAQKTLVGPMHSVNSTTIRYRTDTTGGNSGSPVVHENTGLVVGVHTHAGCSTSSSSSNPGTRIDRSDWVAARAALRPSQCQTSCGNVIINGDFATGSISPWVEGGWACATGVSQHDCAGSGLSETFNCLLGGKAGQTRRPNGYWPGNTIEQSVMMIQGLTYLFTADIQVENVQSPATGNADAGLIEVFVDGNSVGSHNFGRYTGNTKPRDHMCFTFTPQSTGCKALVIDFSRKYYCSSRTPTAFIDNVKLVMSPTLPIICPRGERKVNATASIDIMGTPGANFALLMGTGKTPFGITIPGFNGQWWLDGLIFNLFAASFDPATGGYNFAPPIPNDPNLVGLLLTWQAIEAPGAVNIGEVTSFAFYQ